MEQQLRKPRPMIESDAQNMVAQIFASLDQGFAVLELVLDEAGVLTDYRILASNELYLQLECNPEQSQTAGKNDLLMRLYSSGHPENIEYRHTATGQWYQSHYSRIGEAGSRLVAVVIDRITQRKYAERRHSFLILLDDAVRSLGDPAAIADVVTELATDFFKAGQCYYWSIPDVSTSSDMPDQLPIRLPIPQITGSAMFQDAIAQTTPLVVHDIHTDARVDDPFRESCLAMQMVSFAAIPVSYNGITAGVFCIAQSAPRKWEAFETDMAAEIAERCCEAVTRAMNEEALRQSELEKTFLLKLSDSFKRLTEPMDVVESACYQLVFYLDASRAQLCEIAGETGEEIGTVLGEFVRDGQPMTRQYPLAEFGDNLVQVLRDGQTLLLTDISQDPRIPYDRRKTFFAVDSPAAISFPLVEKGCLVATFSVHDRTPRQWTSRDIAMTGKVAERVWEAFKRARAEEATARSEEKYRTLFHSIDEGFCTIEVLFEKGEAVDYLFLETNEAFERQTGLTDAVGKTIRELSPELEDFWIRNYGVIAKTGKPQRFEHEARSLNRWFDVFAFSIGALRERKVAVLFKDILPRKRRETALHDLTAQLERQVSERTQKLQKSERELLEVNEQLRETITRLESFNYITSHDLQEPLRKAQLFASRLDDPGLTEEKKALYRKAILDSTTKMGNLIEGLLLYAQLGTNKATFTDVDLNVVLAQVCADFDLLIADRGATIQYAPLPTFKAMLFEIRQLFANLISNALKFCDRTPHIEIRHQIIPADAIGTLFKTRKNTDYLVISVADNGIGFDNAEAASMFQLFKRLENADRFAGTGVGLSIAEKVARDHNGHIEASGEKGAGAVFTVYLPYRK